MGNAFSPDGPLAELLEKAWNLLVLNILTVVCCLPVVTIGCSITAAYSVCKQIREGHASVFRTFFEAFSSNWKQATILWMILFLILQILIVDYAIVLQTQPQCQDILEVVLLVSAVLWLMTMLWTFALQASFDNKVTQTLKNAFLLSFGFVFRSIIMVVVVCLPVACFWLVDSSIVIVVVVLYGVSLPIYGNHLLLRKTFASFGSSDGL